MEREAYSYRKLDDGEVLCLTCQRRCSVAEGQRGWCKTRENRGGKLYSLIYGEVSTLSVNPIEKKPVFHFYPGSRWLSLGSVGCNFRCPGCQNSTIAHWKGGQMDTGYLSPEHLVSKAKAAGCIGISFTFNEPALWFEYTLDVAKLSKAKGLYTNYVTNGFIAEEAFDMIAPFLDVYRVDIKGFSEEAYSRVGHIKEFRGILEVAEKAKKSGMHVEVVTNVIPGLNDNESELRCIASWIRDSLGPEVPWHVTRFYPHLDLSHLSPTPVSTLERAKAIGQEEGLWYVYLGNVPGHEGENTYCYTCGELLVERHVFDVIKNRMVGNKCPQCNAIIPGRFGRKV